MKGFLIVSLGRGSTEQRKRKGKNTLFGRDKFEINTLQLAFHKGLCLVD